MGGWTLTDSLAARQTKTKTVDEVFAQIEDPVERALQRELFRLETETAHLVHLQNDAPWKDAFELRHELDAWMIEHAKDPAQAKYAKLCEYEKRSKPIERRLARWRRMDLVALMDREFELTRQSEQIKEHRQSRAWYENRKRADDSMLAKWRVFIRLEEIRLDALAKHHCKAATKTTTARTTP